jgi:hypothetical protein
LPVVRTGFMLDLLGGAVNTGGIALGAPFFFNRMERRRNPKHLFRPPHEKELGCQIAGHCLRYVPDNTHAERSSFAR